jgi:hypothetical protein
MAIMPDDDNDTRTIEEKVQDLQDQVEALHADIRAANAPIGVLLDIVAKLIHDPRYSNRLAISAEYERFFQRQIPVRDDGGGGK